MLKSILTQKFPNFELKPISGGDINEAFVLIADSEHYFVKYNSKPVSKDMFEAESLSLSLLRKNRVRAPKPIEVLSKGQAACLILEYIKPAQFGVRKNYEAAGTMLAHLHLNNQKSHGWSRHNYIGHLNQSNDQSSHWPEFYINQRIRTQLINAHTRGYLDLTDMKVGERFCRYWMDKLPHATPSCLHGDLWSGNLYFDSEGNPWFIDPALYYGHHEVDLAMTKLFGSFPKVFYDAYDVIKPRENGEKERLPIYQLYYLLVHLNLFGLSYKSSCMNIMKNYA